MAKVVELDLEVKVVQPGPDRLSYTVAYNVDLSPDALMTLVTRCVDKSPPSVDGMSDINEYSKLRWTQLQRFGNPDSPRFIVEVKGTPHCECTLLSYFDTNSTLSPYDYIGVSKLMTKSIVPRKSIHGVAIRSSIYLGYSPLF